MRVAKADKQRGLAGEGLKSKNGGQRQRMQGCGADSVNKTG